MGCDCQLLIKDKNSSGDEIANVNFLRRYGTYVLQNTKKREPINQSINQSKRIYIAPYVAGESEARLTN